VTRGSAVALIITCVVLCGVVAMVVVAVGASVGFLPGLELYGLENIGAPRVGLVTLVGEIFVAQPTVEALQKMEKRDDVCAILLRVDSPGGGVVASQEIHDEVMRIRENGEKPVVVSMGSVAASGGYYVACASNAIVANPGTACGSIGVLTSYLNAKDLCEKIGISFETLTTGDFKGMGELDEEMTPEQREVIQAVLDDIHDQFVAAVSEGRNLPYDRVAEIADGRIFTGRQALDLGLVDEVGNLRDAVMLAGELAGVEREPVLIDDAVPTFGFFDEMKGLARQVAAKLADSNPKFELVYR